jgi:hypothetical protein
MGRPRSLVSVANEQVSFTRAASWAGLSSGGERDRGLKVTCPSCGGQGALRVYPGHGYCFGERRRWTAVSLLAEKWELDEEHAAVRALDMIGYVPPDFEHMWDIAQRQPEVARENLARALRIWCEVYCADWVVRQYAPAVADRLSRCLGLLPGVLTEDQCNRWLVVCKEAMRRVLSLP